MNTRFPGRGAGLHPGALLLAALLLAALLLAALPLGAPAASLATDNVAAGTDNAAVLPPAADNASVLPAGTDNGAAVTEKEDFREPDFGEGSAPPATIADPIEPVNRAFFVFNEKAYYWVLKPVARGYNAVVAEGIRVSIRNFFNNLGTPARVANNLLQGNLRATGTELLRFAMNSTMGILGLFDTARDGFGIEQKDADLGQTLGKYGIGQGMYLVLPLLGPTTLRDGVGSLGDSYLDPVTYVDPWEAELGLRSYRAENDISLRLGMYEELTGAAVDPYISVRDFYIQNRAGVVRGKK
ncbi:MAG: VacJ family lipoprotein [Deltaproteobacteria bacterium]|nr:VacJ family lipoprotein [Deltaproteobacteria bacterium]